MGVGEINSKKRSESEEEGTGTNIAQKDSGNSGREDREVIGADLQGYANAFAPQNCWKEVYSRHL